jgi:hypothetical protein
VRTAAARAGTAATGIAASAGIASGIAARSRPRWKRIIAFQSPLTGIGCVDV